MAHGPERRRGLAQGLAQGVELGEQLGVALPQGGHLVLEIEDAAYALEADAGRGQVGDHAQQLEVAVGVAATAAAGAAGRDQAHPLVGAQRLRVQAGQLGGDGDDVDGGVGVGRAERRTRGDGRHHDDSKRLARSGRPAVAAR